MKKINAKNALIEALKMDIELSLASLKQDIEIDQSLTDLRLKELEKKVDNLLTE